MKVKVLKDINSVFKRYHGWSGGDGVYTNIYKNKIIWYFSDTFIGDSFKNGMRKDFKMIHNSFALSSLAIDDIEFIYNEHSDDLFVMENGYHWLQDGIIINDNLYIYALNMENDVFSNNIFLIKGYSLIKICLPIINAKLEYKICFYRDIDKNVTLGAAVIFEDNYYYVYGYINSENNKKLIIARTRSLETGLYEYLHFDNTWSSSLENLKVIKEYFAAEFKIIKIDGCFFLAYTKFGIGDKIFLIVSEDITFISYKEFLLYCCPEHKGTIITYNAKIQKALSNRDELIISYNVNTLNNNEHIYLDIYRPRFIKVKISDIKKNLI